MPGVIAAGGPATAAAGAAMLAQGGNAVDAAVAATFASFIAEIAVVHLGGSGIAQLFDPTGNRSLVYDFFSVMPGVGRDKPAGPMDFGKVTINFGPTTQDFYLGRASVAVPGNIAGLCQLAADFGRLPLSTLLEPALKLAAEGVILEPFQASTADLLSPLYTHTEGIRQVFAPNGRLLQAGERLFVPDLAATLAQLAEAGEAFARTGRLAQAILADQAAHGGLLTATDLSGYEVKTPTPIRIPYRDYEILLPPPSSSGGVLTAFTLKLMRYFDLAALPHGSTRHLRLLYELMAATTRARPLWEQAITTMSPAEALSTFLADDLVQRYADEVTAAISDNQPSTARLEPRGPSATSHLSVMDSDGLAIGLTTTAGESAGYVVPGTGYIPNNMLGEADLHPRGFHADPAGQRILTMMTPTVVLKDGRIRLVTGSGGSIRIRSAIMQTLSNFLDYQMPLDQAVNSARVHLEEKLLQCELGFDETAVAELERTGYPINRWDRRSIYFGGAHSVARTDSGELVAAGDDRRGGATAVVP
jgi:gamma-glutamyltranspeptidase/glutathione hydrolase